ncbi:DUF2442 domain-containing protein [Desulfosarcina variabilis]|uniref:DUF2442 domain-containing protein n=1 Tax=Desulfosarcina variabilis TaxID=2300 RepID=UPI003AFB140D
MENEITNISKFGVWILISTGELFMPYDEFPWFKDASIDQIHNVQEPHPGHLYWPDLDVDLDVKSIIDPNQYPLKYKP